MGGKKRLLKRTNQIVRHDGYNTFMRRLCLLLAFVASTAACEIRDDAHNRASLGIEPGMPEEQAIAVAGAPSRTAKTGTDDLLCGKEGGVRELLYDATTVYFGGLKESLEGVVVVCLDSNGVVLAKYHIEF